MQRVSQILQLAVVVAGDRQSAPELQRFEKLDLVFCRTATQGGILEERLESRFFAGRCDSFPFHELESFGVFGRQAPISTQSPSRTAQVDVPGFNQRIEKRRAVLI